MFIIFFFCHCFSEKIRLDVSSESSRFTWNIKSYFLRKIKINKSAAGTAWCPATALTSSEVTVLNLCTSSSHALYCTKFWEIIWNDIKVIEWTWFLYWKFQREIILQKDTISKLTIYKITKWHKTEKTVEGVTVHNQSLVILYLYQVSWNDLKPYQSYRADTISMP